MTLSIPDVLRSSAPCGVMIALACDVASAATSYVVAEIPMPPGAASISPQGVNSRGDVVGYYTLANGELHAFSWSGDAQVTTLAPLPGHSQTTARGISDSGVIVGNSGPSFQPDRAVVWSGGRPPQSLGTFGGPWSAANGVSSTGLVAGWSQVEMESNRFHGFVYDGATVRDVGLLPEGVVTDLADVNASGVAVGICQTIEGYFHAVLADPAEGLLDLGTLGGVTSEATCINDAGHVVGRAQTGVRSQATYEGIVRHAFFWKQGKMLDLGTLPSLVESRALCVNASDQVVGTANNEAGTVIKPFLWQNGSMIDVNSLLPAGSGWTLRTANAINDDGAIVGDGLFNGQPRGYVLRPVSDKP